MLTEKEKDLLDYAIRSIIRDYEKIADNSFNDEIKAVCEEEIKNYKEISKNS